MSTTTPPNLGNIIPSGLVRRIVYAVYVVAAVVVGATAAYFIGIGEQLPEIVVGAQAVITWLGVPVGGLALANTSTAAPAEHRA